MNNKITKTSFLLSIAALVACSPKTPIIDNAPTSTKPIVILYDNDVHCAIDNYPIVAYIRDSIATQNSAHIALVSSGDYLQGGAYGALGQGKYIVKLLNALNYDAIGLGNHEFDYKMKRFFELTDSIKAPIVSANFTDTLGNLVFKPYQVVNFGEKKVAFVGILTPETMKAESYAFYDSTGKKTYDLHMDDFADYVQKAVTTARLNDKADYVVALSHLGEKSEWSSQDLLTKINGIDVVLDGHSHSLIKDTIPNKDSVYIQRIQTGTQLQYIGLLKIYPNGQIETDTIHIDTNSTKNPFVEKILNSIKSELAPTLDSAIAETKFDLTIKDSAGNRAIRKQETNLGDLVSDALLHATNAQISFVNGGGIRKSINSGKIKYEDVINVFPNKKDLCILEATGKQIYDFLEVSSSIVPNENGAFAQVSGLEFTIDTNIHSSFEIMPNDNSLKMNSERRVKNVLLVDSSGNKTPIDTISEKKYLIGTTTYVAFESEENPTLQKAENIKILKQNDTDALADFLKNKLGGIVPDKYNNISGQERIHFDTK